MTIILGLTLALGVGLLPLRLGSVGPPAMGRAHQAPANALPHALAEAIRSRFGALPITAGSATPAGSLVPSPGGWRVEGLAGVGLNIGRDGAITARSAGATATLAPSFLVEGAKPTELALPVASATPGRLAQAFGPVIASEYETTKGLEQTFTVPLAPQPDVGHLELGFRSTTRWAVSADGTSLVGPRGLAYRGLRVTDAIGRVLPSHFVLHPSGPAIHVGLAGARFPIRIDPTWSSDASPGATLTAGGAPPGNLGVAVSLSGDGTTALVGASAASSFTGAAYIFRAGANGSWSSTASPAATLSAPELAAGDLFGQSVALSQDGTTAVVAAEGHNQNTGAAYVFQVASETAWSSTSAPTATLTNAQGAQNDRFGFSVALSADGLNALVGAPNAGSGNGAAYVFHSAMSGWSSSSMPTATLTATGHPLAGFGGSVTIAGDGRTALVGAPNDQGGLGAGFIFQVANEAAWVDSSVPTAILTHSGGATTDHLGTILTISGDGTTALMSVQTGAAYLYHVVSESSWGTTSTPTAILTNGGGSNDFDFGVGLAFSETGTTAVIGDDAVPDGNFVGAVYVFQVPSASAWSGTLRPTATLTNGAGQANDGLGSAIALSSTNGPQDGQVILAGADGVNGGAGAAAMFDRLTSISMSATPASSSAGQTVTFSAKVTATGGPPTGTVTFTTGSTTLCTGTLAGGSASCTGFKAPPGTDSVVATYSGDANFDPSSAMTTLIVAPAATRAGPSVAPTVDHNGYWLSNPDGSVRPFGNAGSFGSMQGRPLNAPIVGIAGAPASQGYWLVGSDGGIFAFGDAGFFGSMGGQPINQPIVGITATPDGHGYWLVASDGGVFAFGDAGFFGSMGGQPLNKPIVDLTANPDGHGYWLVGSDGGIFAFGEASFFGSMGGQQLNQPIVGIDARPTGHGYWLVATDGGVFAFGDAGFFGSGGGRPGALRVIGLIPTRAATGYLLINTQGGAQTFGA